MKLIRHTLLLFTCFLLLSSIGCSFQKQEKTEPVVTYGIIRMEDAVKVHPDYAKYHELLDEYNNLQRRYEVEQASLVKQAEEESRLLEGIRTDSSLTKALDLEYNNRIQMKEAELNHRLSSAYENYLNQFQRNGIYDLAEVDLKIVNLQLELQSLLLSDEMRKNKEEELSTLLKSRSPKNLGANDALSGEIQKAMAPIKAQAESELKAYADNIMQELLKKRDEQLSQRMEAIKASSKLPDPVVWHNEWKQKLDMKKAEVQAAHDSILEDIRIRVESIAEEKGLELVVSEYEHNFTAVDITDTLIAAYGKL